MHDSTVVRRREQRFVVVRCLQQSEILLISRLHPPVAAAVSCQENDGWKAEETIEKGGRVYTCSNGGKGKRCLLRILL